MGFMYNGYSVMPGPNDPGWIIRDGRDIGDAIVGNAPTAQAARDFIDGLIAAKAKVKK